MNRTRQLLQTPERTGIDPAKVFAAISQDVCENVDCDLGSVWLFDESRTRITCHGCYDALADTFSSGTVLAAVDYPIYFRHIVEETIISAPQARSQMATREFTRDYFEPKGIISLLDLIIHDNMKPVGVICCENRRGIRDWSEKDKNYLMTLSALASFYFKVSK